MKRIDVAALPADTDLFDFIENLGKEIVIICDDGENKIRVIAETFSSQINDLIRLKIDRENVLLF